YISFVPLVFQVILGVFLIPVFGVVGAAYAFSLTFIAVAIITILVFCWSTGTTLADVIYVRRADFAVIFVFIKKQWKLIRTKMMVMRVLAREDSAEEI
ncbi:MAG: hypothetical protein KJ732_03650, partial [Candidatus Margulisbacteria bacterium]|nr:hypothetical protein [Candidatus Margulisiibacteriota bacterium]